MLLQAAISGLLNGGVYALISMGLALIFGVVRVVNFAHGEFLMVGMYLAYWAFVLLGVDPHLALFDRHKLFFVFRQSVVNADHVATETPVHWEGRTRRPAMKT